MENPLTTRVESYLGAIFISLFALFFVGLIFIALKNFQSDSDILSAQEVKVKNISATERALMENWIQENSIKIPEGQGYRYLIQQYPARPWLKL